MPRQEKEELCVGKCPHDYDDVPESFFTVGWWKKPNPFPRSTDSWRKETEWEVNSYIPIRREQTSGYSGQAGSDDLDHTEAFERQETILDETE